LSLPAGFAFGFLQDPIGNLGHARARNQHRAFYDAAATAYTQNVTAYIANAGRLRSVPMDLIDANGERIGSSKRIDVGTQVRVTGSLMPSRRMRVFSNSASFTVPVEHEGDRGFISIQWLSLEPPNP